MALAATPLDRFLQWSSGHWGWVLGAVILCLVVLAAIFLSLGATGEAEDAVD